MTARTHFDGVLIIGAERELRTWLRHHIEILWPDATVDEQEPAELEQRAAGLTTKNLDLIVLGEQCGEALEDPAAHLHVYDKREVFERRKMGHVTVVAGEPEEALARARSASEALHWEDEA